MRRLLWKEWQERRLWLLLWALALVGAGVWAQAQSPFGLEQSSAGWGVLPCALALLAGVGAYGSELSGGRATFLYSRACCWKRLLLAKVLLGLTVAVGAPLLTALLLRLCAPALYLPFITPATLLLGTVWVICLNAILFLIGLGCSIVLAGLAGSMLVLLGYLGLFFLMAMLLQKLIPNLYTPPLFLMICFISAPVLAAIIIARFGITLSPGARLRRFALLLSIPILAGFLLTCLPQQASTSFDYYVWSPSAKYLFAERWEKDSPRQYSLSRHQYWVDIAKHRCLPLPPKQTFCAWASNDCMITQTDDDKPAEGCTISWLKNGQLCSHHLATRYYYHPLASPDGTKVLLPIGKQIILYDLQTENTQSIPISWPKTYRNTTYGPDCCWWQAADVIGYLRPGTGERVLVKVRM